SGEGNVFAGKRKFSYGLEPGAAVHPCARGPRPSAPYRELTPQGFSSRAKCLPSLVTRACCWRRFQAAAGGRCYSQLICLATRWLEGTLRRRSEEHTSELQSR